MYNCIESCANHVLMKHTCCYSLTDVTALLYLARWFVVDCVDTRGECHAFATEQYCKTHSLFMRRYCPRTCNFCVGKTVQSILKVKCINVLTVQELWSHIHSWSGCFVIFSGFPANSVSFYLPLPGKSSRFSFLGLL